MDDTNANFRPWQFGDEYLVAAMIDVTDHMIDKSIVQEDHRKRRAKLVSVRK